MGAADIVVRGSGRSRRDCRRCRFVHVRSSERKMRRVEVVARAELAQVVTDEREVSAAVSTV